MSAQLQRKRDETAIVICDIYAMNMIKAELTELIKVISNISYIDTK